MSGDITKSADAKHATNFDEIDIYEAKYAPKRSYGERGTEENQRPETGAMNELIKRSRAVRNSIRLHNSLCQRQEQNRQDSDPKDGHPSAPIEPDLPGGPHCAHQ